MTTVILDPELERRLIADRVACGADRYDEVWEGTYMMAPMPNNEHQWFVARLSRLLDEVVGDASLGRVYPGVNVSDRRTDWEKNYRVPDVAVFLNGTTAIDHGEFWQGGPDFAVEIVSPGDKSRDKIDFYSDVGTRELLIIDRDPWQIELYRLSGGSLILVATTTANAEDVVTSDVTGLAFALQENPQGDRPALTVTETRSGQSWKI